MAQVPCQNCGFGGERGASDACPRCGHVARATEEFRVPPLPPPTGPVGSDIEPERLAPPGGYLELDLGLADAGRGLDAPPPGPISRERRRPTQRTGPAFAAVAPRPVPGSPRSVMPIFIGVGAGCLALILAGVWLSRGSGSTAAPAAVAAPAPIAPSVPPAPAPQPAARPAEPAPSSEVLAAPAAVPPAPEPRETRPARSERAARKVQAAATPPAPVPAPARARTPAAVPTQPAAATAAAAVAPAPLPLPAPPTPVEDAPRYLAEGFRRPQMEEPGCVSRSIRPPRDIAERVTDTVTIRFAVGPDGAVSLFQVMGDVPDPRVPDLLEQAVRKCRWTPGADPQGTPIRIWVTMPVRFAK